LLLENESRINEAKPVRYWYPLSLATYGTDEIVEALDSMCSFRTSMAEKTLSFERKFTKWQGSTDAVMVNSGSSADLLLCMLLTNSLSPIIPVDSEILIPVVTWPTQVWSAMMAGLKVKFVDVDPETLNIDIDDLERSIGPDSKAIFLVHLMGNPCDMDRIINIANKHNLVILEDCCEAMGASWAGTKVGNFGVGAAYSFFFSHHITSMEGGMIAVPDIEKAEQLKILRSHGWIRDVDPVKYGLHEHEDIDPRYAFINWGLNVRPTEVQAGFGMRQLEKADTFAKRREEIANKVNTYIGKSTWLHTPIVHEKASPSWLALPIMVDPSAPFKRSEFTKYLEDLGIETRPIVTGNLAKHPVTKRLLPDQLERKYPGADEVHNRGFYIGLSPLLTDETVDRLIDVFEEYLNKF